MNKLNVDLSITISVIIALAAIISPILTALINNSHQKKMKELELEHDFYEKSKSYQRNIFENYLAKAGNYIGSKCLNMKARQEYNEAYLQAFLYAPQELQELMRDADRDLQKENYIIANPELEHLIPYIQEYLKKL